MTPPNDAIAETQYCIMKFDCNRLYHLVYFRINELKSVLQIRRGNRDDLERTHRNESNEWSQLCFYLEIRKLSLKFHQYLVLS